MKNKILLSIIVIVLVLGGIFLYSQNKTDNLPMVQEQKIKLGLMFPLTSQFGSVAEGVRNASLLAVEEWQKSNPTIKVETVVEDDAYDPKKGVTIYNKFKNIDKVQGIVSISTPVVDALYKTYQTDGIPVVNLGLQTEGVSRDNIFQMFPDAKGQIKPLADYLTKKTDYDSIVIVHSTSDPAYAQFYNEFIKLYPKAYKDVVINTPESSKITANKILATKSQAIVIILPPAVGSAVTKELKLLDKDNLDYYFDGSLTTGWSEYKKMLGDTNILNGAITVKTASTDMTAFKAAYKLKYNLEPSIFAEYGYDSTMVILNSYDKNVVTWVNNIQKTSYIGPSGKITFDDNGVKIPEFVVVEVLDGQIQDK